MTDRSVFRNGATVLVIGVCVTLISLVPSTVTTSVSRVIQNCLSLVFVFCFFFRIRIVECFTRSSAFSSSFGITQCLRKQGFESGYAVVLHA